MASDAAAGSTGVPLYSTRLSFLQSPTVSRKCHGKMKMSQNVFLISFADLAFFGYRI